MNKTIYILAAIMAALLTGIASASDDSLDSFVSKDKVWHYNKCTYYHMPDERMDIEEGHLLTFTSNDTLINNTAYSILTHLSPESDAVDTLAFMREEGGRLFVINNNPVADRREGEVPPDTEIMAFDFNAEVGQSYRGIVIGDYTERGDVFVNSVGSTTVDGIVLRTQRIWHSPDVGQGQLVVEGIGCDGPSWFYLPQLGMFCAGGHDDVNISFYLDSVTDAKGNVIFAKEEFKNARIETVYEESPTTKTSHIYDLNGREIRNPEPGTVYIQGGRKHVAPRR